MDGIKIQRCRNYVVIFERANHDAELEASSFIAPAMQCHATYGEIWRYLRDFVNTQSVADSLRFPATHFKLRALKATYML